MNASITAVIFDLGGVVFPSPIEAMRDFEAERGLPHRFLSEVILGEGEDGAWNRMERGELTVEGFAPAFETECATAGHTVDALSMMAYISSSFGPRPEMLTAIEILRERGRATAALTNNWVADPNPSTDRQVSRLEGIFDVVVESARVGLRKPDPRIYELVCAQLEVAPPAAAFLDDLGTNLKPARAMGMTTIKVADPRVALDELGAALGFPLSR